MNVVHRRAHKFAYVRFYAAVQEILTYVGGAYVQATLSQSA